MTRLIAGTVLAALSLAAQAPAQEAVVEDIEYSLANFDADGDGKVSAEEFKGDAAIDFIRLDLDEDGLVTEQDLAIARQRAAEPSDPSDPEVAGPAVDIGRVFDLDRDAAHDRLVLVGGDELRGQILTGSFTIQTVYGAVELPVDRVAGIDLEAGPERFDRMVAINGDVVSGICLDREIAFHQVGASTPIRIRREKVLRFARRAVPGETEGLGRRQYLLMSNGDHFSGRVAAEGLALRTHYGEFALDLARLDRIEVARGDEKQTVVHTLEGETLRGSLAPEDLTVELDLLAGVASAGSLSIHAYRIGVLHAREGFVPEVTRIEPGAATLVFDFEDGPQGWTIEGGDTTWHHTRAEAASGQASFECAAAGALAYTNSARAALLSPALDLSTIVDPVLLFSRKVMTEDGYDFLIVEVSYDGATNFQELGKYTGMLGWERIQFPLAADAATVHVRFRFQSDDSEVQRGVWVDHVEIRDRG